ncbi:MAG TPA: sigma-54 dependent transcriptional regulator [Polyangia bacterium]|nr:sigma-54 dependent transcriptional regulator [Polyangia bacterium]
MPILVVDDDASVRSLLRTLLARAGHVVVEAEDGKAAIDQLAQPFDVILTDLVMPRADGFEVLRRARERQPRTPVVVLTAEGSIRDCVEAMRAGAFNFVTKPFHARDLQELVERAVRSRGDDGRPAATALGDEGRPQVALVGDSEAMRGVLDMIERIAHTNATVLVTGESGTGKEVVARLLHGSSGRSQGPFVAVNCGAIPESLIESELFGHVKGSFTGAHETRAGKFIQASGGTLFLDEIGELPLAMQVKLLRVLQEREVTPIGDAKARAIDVRIIAATNVDLEAMVADGRFRQDLYYRLEVLPVHLPALRERAADIVPLARHFLDAANRRLGTTVVLTEDALALLKLHQWPGNVREMENVFERLVILSRTGTITAADLPAKMRTATGPTAAVAAASAMLEMGAIDLAATLAAIEASLVEQALRQTGGNRTRAAELLGLSRTTLVDKLKRR